MVAFSSEKEAITWWSNPTKNRRSSVPRHAEVNDILARKICKDLEIPKPGKT
jgi:mRNA interferase HicA